MNRSIQICWLMLLLAVGGPSRAQDEDAPVTAVSALSASPDAIRAAVEFIFAPGQDVFYGLPSPIPTNGGRGYETLAIEGGFVGTERYLQKSIQDLTQLYFPNRLVNSGNSPDATILMVGVNEMADIETDDFKAQYSRYLEASVGESVDRITAPDNLCTVVRARRGATIDRTLIVAWRGNKTILVGRQASAAASCLNRGTFYHFGYSNVGIYGRKQFAINRSAEISMDIDYAPPRIPAMLDGSLVGKTRSDFLASIAMRAGSDEAASLADERKLKATQAAELEEATGRDYSGTPFGDTRIIGTYRQVRYFDRWAFQKNQRWLVANPKDYTQVFYAGLLTAEKPLTDFNVDTLKQSGWHDVLLATPLPQAADLLIVGVEDVSLNSPATVEKEYGWSLYSGTPDHIYTQPKWETDDLVPTGLEISCKLYRSRVGSKVGSTLAIVKIGAAIRQKKATPDDLVTVVDCINRAHYFHAGFSNLGYQPVGTFARLVAVKNGGSGSNHGYGLPEDIPAVAPTFMLNGQKGLPLDRKQALMQYYKFLRGDKPLQHVSIGGKPERDGL